MKLLSLFSGIGAPEKALKNIGIAYELVNYCEIDKYASKAYAIVHDENPEKNLGDITKVDTSKLPNAIDLIMYGFPCQDISNAGKQKGFVDENGNRTRSGLFFEALRIIQDTQPKYAIAENVKALVGKKFAAEFKTVLDSLNDSGYNNYWQVLNAKDYGIPQNRERVFIVSIRKDIDQGTFTFPEKQELKLRLKDMLEQNVDEKYYLKETKEFFIRKSLQMEARGNGFRFSPHVKDKADIAKTITTRAGGRVDDNFVMDNENITDKSTFTFNSENVPYVPYIKPICLNSKGGVAGLQPSIAEPMICASRGRGEPPEQRLEAHNDGLSNALTTVQKDNYVIEPSILKPERTEFAKSIRKDYEKGIIKAKRKELTQYAPRTDGLSNTLTTVQKDNYVI